MDRITRQLENQARTQRLKNHYNDENPSEFAGLITDLQLKMKEITAFDADIPETQPADEPERLTIEKLNEIRDERVKKRGRKPKMPELDTASIQRQDQPVKKLVKRVIKATIAGK